MTIELEKRLTDLFADPSFQEEAKKYTTAEELQKGLASHDIQMTDAEVNELLLAIGKCVADDSSELSEDSLESVTGGFGFVTAALIVVCIGAVGGLALGIYNGYQSAKNADKRNSSN